MKPLSKNNTVVEWFETRADREKRLEELKKNGRRDLQRSTTQALSGKLDKKKRPLGRIWWLLSYPQIERVRRS